MKLRLLSINPFLTWLTIISVSIAFIAVISILLINILHRPEYNSEVLKYFDRSFLERSWGYNKTALAISISRKILAWIFTIAAVVLAFKYLSKTPRIPILMAMAFIAMFYILCQSLLVRLQLKLWCILHLR